MVNPPTAVMAALMAAAAVQEVEVMPRGQLLVLVVNTAVAEELEVKTVQMEQTLQI